MKKLDSLPARDGFRMPGEFEKHAGTYLLWPERTDNWRNGAKPAQKVFAEVADAISEFEQVTVGVSDRQYAHCLSLVNEKVRVVELSSDDSWMRDCGPTCVTDGRKVRGIDWDFNAWGGLTDGLYFPWDRDDRVAKKVCGIESLDFYSPSFVLEGGSIHTDGEGTLLTTEECLLSAGRNPSLDKSQIENTLREMLGVRKVIWLPRGIWLDETNGHVDNICCFSRPGEVLLAWTEDRDDPQYEISSECLRVLEREKDAMGRTLKVKKMLLPKPVVITEEESRGVDAVDGTLPRRAGDRLAASYINFYLVNGGVIFPLFDDPNDEKARKTLEETFPDRKVVGIRAREILLGGGNIHCITQQIPAGGN